jgi:hypothetical protein
MFQIVEAGGRMFILMDLATNRAVTSFAPYDEGDREAALVKVRAFANGFIEGFNYCKATIPPASILSTVKTL